MPYWAALIVVIGGFYVGWRTLGFCPSDRKPQPGERAIAPAHKVSQESRLGTKSDPG
jgi:hypothetical protein